MAGPTVNARHRIYQKLQPRWVMVRDAVEGEYAVKQRGDAYLPKLHEQDQTAYDAYKLRALFFEATRRTMQGLVGMVMRKDPTVEASDSTKEGFLKRLTKNNLSLEGFANVVMQEVLMMNKYGILADLPPVIKTGAEPWLVGYTAESMINWKYDTDADGKKVLVRMVLEETYGQTKADDRFKVVDKDQWRVLELVSKELVLTDLAAMDKPPVLLFDPAQQNIYRVQVWRRAKDQEGLPGKAAKEDEFILYDTVFPTLRGKVMDVIPFVVVTSGDSDDENQKPPIEGLASVNMSHYRTSADLEHGRHFTALPTPYVIGLSEQASLVIGSSKAWVISGVDATQVAVGMLEFKGQGLKALETGMSEKQAQMAILGARLLEEQVRKAEAFETHELRSAGEHSVLASIANGASEGINEALLFMTAWDTSLGTIMIQLNTEFVRVGMAPEMLMQLLAALQAGKISFKAYFFKMQQGGMYPDEHTEEEELAQLEDDAAKFGTGVDDLDEEEEEEEEEEDEDD
jgi:Domain of unknown function (DUF4055)